MAKPKPDLNFAREVFDLHRKKGLTFKKIADKLNKKSTGHIHRSYKYILNLSTDLKKKQ